MVSLPPPLTQCCLEGNAKLMRGEGERFVVVSGFLGQSSHSFRSVSTVLSKIVVEFHLKLPYQFSEKPQLSVCGCRSPGWEWLQLENIRLMFSIFLFCFVEKLPVAGYGLFFL